MNYNIKLMNKIAASGTDIFDRDRYDVGEALENPHGIMVRSANLHDMQFDDSLLAIARAGAGVNNIPIDVCSKKGVVVFNTPGANANAVKELTIAALFLASRDITGGVEWAKTLAGDPDCAKAVEKGKSRFEGPEIHGKTLGVIGLGAIGVMVANVAHDLGMDVYGYDPYISIGSAWGLSRKIHKADTLKEIFEVSDYITVHVPLNPSTKGSINAETISQMKYGVRILNLARGEIVDYADMDAALRSGKVAKYVTDFPSPEVLEMPNTVAIPHLGASTPESEINCACMAARELRDYIESGAGSKLLGTNAASSADKPPVTSVASQKRMLAELKELIEVKIPQNAAAVAYARSFGDLRENAEYDAAKEQRRFLQKRRSDLEKTLANIESTSFKDVVLSNVVVPGCKVFLKNAAGSELSYYILGAWDGDPERGRISYKAPIGQALTDRKVGEKVKLPELGEYVIERLEPLPADMIREFSGEE